jgi:hypothetical protein
VHSPPSLFHLLRSLFFVLFHLLVPL